MFNEITSGFNDFSEDVVQYHSYIVSLMSGIIIGLITNYVITYFTPINSILNLSLNLIALIIAVYLALIYSPNIKRKGVHFSVPRSLSMFLKQNYTAFLVFIRLDLDWYAFKDDFPSFSNFNIKENVSVESGREEDKYPWQMVVTYSFLKIFKCKINLNIRVIESKRYNSVNIEIELNRNARFHHKTDRILKTIGTRISLAITNPQLINPQISNEELKRIMDELY
ncbi:MAG: hypothetical protein NWE89_00060 [Candidatus Bathyarchaeota archaeon]|nr:hypothetical protein [Candidatus Bathyarchaeota archaeon]